MNILIIGGGNMGLTYAQSFLRSHITSATQMMILQRSEIKTNALRSKNIAQIFNNPAECLPKADLIILAVKPQDSKVLFEQIRPFVSPSQVFLSIIAGVKIEVIAEALGINKVVRAMPNLPAQVGMGMTTFTCTDTVTRLELVTVQNLLSTTGKTIYVAHENLIDASTAISGSGPAYVYFFMNAMIEAAQKMGFSDAEAAFLVNQTFTGAMDLFNKADLSCTDWIARVASKGGTTEAALKSFAQTNLHQSIIAGAIAAKDRAEALGK